MTGYSTKRIFEIKNLQSVLGIIFFPLLTTLLLAACDSATEAIPMDTETETITPVETASSSPSFMISPRITPSPDFSTRKAEKKETKIAETQINLSASALTPTMTPWKYRKPTEVSVDNIFGIAPTPD